MEPTTMTGERCPRECVPNPAAPPAAQAGAAGGWDPRAQRGEALARGKALRLRHPEGVETPGHAAVRISSPMLAALAENVRDYAVFLMDPAGVITFWGKGAHLMKWWTAEEAEGGHLSLLYPEGESEDGTAYGHLCDASEQGEYVGEGQRVRRDGSTFWAGVTLTALRDAHGTLMGFGKVTRDLTAARAREALLATTHTLQTARDVALLLVQKEQAARARAEEAAEFAQAHLRGAREYIAQVLEPELAAERRGRAEADAELRAAHAASASIADARPGEARL